MSTVRLLFFLLASAGGWLLAQEGCPSVARSVGLATDGREDLTTVVERIRQRCAAAPDSLSQVYHQLSVGAGRAGDFVTAADLGERALVVQRERYADTLRLPLAKTLANLGLFYFRLGQYRRASGYLTEAEQAYRTLDVWRRRHNVREVMVYLWHTTGDVGRAATLLEVMEAEARAQPPSYVRDLSLAETLRLRGVQAVETGDYAAGIGPVREAIALFDGIGEVGARVEAEMEIARLLEATGDYAGARRQTTASLATVEPYDMPYDKAVMQSLLVLLHRSEGAPDRARAAYEEGLVQARLNGSPRLFAVLDQNLAEVELAAGNPAAALAAARRAVAVLVDGWRYSAETPLPTTDQLVASEYRASLLEQLAFYAGVQEQTGADAGALETTEAVGVVADQLRTSFTGEVSKLFWRAAVLPAYERAVRLSHARRDPATAFRYLERGRAALLLDALLAAGLPELLTPDQAEAVAENEATTLGLQRRLLADPPNRDSLLAELVAARTAGDRLWGTLSQDRPGLRSLHLRPRPPELTDAQAYLGTDYDRMVHYLSGARTYALVTDAAGARTYDLGPTDSLTAVVEDFVAYFSGAQRIDADPHGFLAAGHRAYRALLEPLALPAGDRLLLLPDGPLAYLPFAALPTGPADGLAQAAYLIRRNPVAYGQSVAVLRTQSAERPAPAGGALVLAPFLTDRPGLPAAPLRYSRAETAGVAALATTETLTDADATRGAFLAAVGEHRVLHLSTHAYATTDGSEPPRVLTADDALYLPDIYGLSLNADLVTLSACQSNLGAVAKGEGVLGLGRAFTAAGARGTVASLWKLNDRATADIVTDFYARLAADRPKPWALHDAQLAYLDRSDLPAYLKSPYYWAGLTYYGDPAPVAVGRRINRWWLGGALTGLLLTGAWILWARRRAVRPSS